MKRIDDERIKFYMKVPDDVIVGDVSEPPGNSGLFRLGRCDWPEEGPAVELGWWHKGKIDFSHNPNKQAVWCGLYADQNSPYWQQLFDARGRPETADYPEWNQREPMYPMFRYLPHPEGNLWEDDQLEAYGQSVIQAVLKAWCDLAPLVNEAVSQSSQ